MNDLQKTFAHWRRIFININLSLAVVITSVEIVMSITLHFQHLILQDTLFEYVYEYLIQPNVVIWGGILLMGLVFLVVERNKEFLQSKSGPKYECGSLYDEILNRTLILMLTLSCGTAAYVHYIFRVTVVGFCIPIFLCVVFYSRRICIETICVIECMLMVVANHRYIRQEGNDPYILEDIVIIMLFMFVFALIALQVIKHMKLQHEQMIEAREAAVVANQAKSNFLANMSHEIRTPINAVMGMDEMILRKSQDEEVLSYALDIKKASNSLLSIINDILDVSKIESGKMVILPVEYDLSGLIHDVYNNVAVRAKDKGLDLLLDVDEKLPNKLIGDDIRIRQIITNLLTNGVKYTLKGSVTLQVTGAPVEEGLLLHVTVRDTGIGIKEEDLPKLKEKFQRIEEQRNRSIEGTGLGMNITSSLLDMMGGSLQIDSEYGVGSCFSFEIKQGVVDSEPIGDLGRRFSELSHVAAQKKEKSWIAPKAKLLVVDDNAMNLKVFNQLLKPFMMRIDSVDSGYLCLEKVEQIRYDIIFLDDMMPGLDGRKTLELMKEMPENQCADTPVIALTANAVKGAMEGYLKAGFDGYLAKPIVPEKLENMILELLGEELVEHSTNEPLPTERELEELSNQYQEAYEEAFADVIESVVAGPADPGEDYVAPVLCESCGCEIHGSGSEGHGSGSEGHGSGGHGASGYDAAGHGAGGAGYETSGHGASGYEVSGYADSVHESDAAKEPVFPEIHGINWQYGMTVWCNADLLLELACDFYDDLPNVIEKLSGWEAEIEEEESMKSFCIRVHALKGAAATIGAMNLSAMALILELASKEKNPEKVHQLWPYLLNMLEEYQESMQVLK